MNLRSEDWTPGDWYWIRKSDQSLAAYRFSHLSSRAGHGMFYVGSQLQTFRLSMVVGRAAPPDRNSPPDGPRPS